MTEQLNRSIKQLHEVKHLMQLCEKFLNGSDDVVLNAIREASSNIDTAAKAISTIVERDALSKNFYNESMFKINDDQDEQTDTNNKQAGIDEFQKAVDQAYELLNHKKK